MSHLKYYNYPGIGEWAAKNIGYSQAVRVEERIEISGQGGWYDDKDKIYGFSDEEEAQIDQAFENVALALKTAGGTGWDQVYKIRTYHPNLTEKTTEYMVKNLKKHCPNHMPIWTEVGVKALGLPEMQVEIEAVAHVGKPKY